MKTVHCTVSQACFFFLAHLPLQHKLPCFSPSYSSQLLNHSALCLQITSSPLGHAPLILFYFFWVLHTSTSALAPTHISRSSTKGGTINPAQRVGEWMLKSPTSHFSLPPTTGCGSWRNNLQFSHQRPPQTLNCCFVFKRIRGERHRKRKYEDDHVQLLDTNAPHAACRRHTEVNWNISSWLLWSYSKLLKVSANFGDASTNLHSGNIIFFKDGCRVSSHETALFAYRWCAHTHRSQWKPGQTIRGDSNSLLWYRINLKSMQSEHWHISDSSHWI